MLRPSNHENTIPHTLQAFSFDIFLKIKVFEKFFIKKKHVLLQFRNMEFLAKVFNVTVYKGGIVPVGAMCIALFHSGKLPNFMGPVGYGITAFGMCGLIKYIIMDMERDRCDRLVGEIEDLKLALRQKQIENESIKEVCECMVEKKNYLVGFRQDSSRLEDKILSIEQRVDVQNVESEDALMAEDQSNSKNQELFQHTSQEKNDSEIENQLKYQQNVERDLEMHIKREEKDLDNAFRLYLEKSDDIFAGELENITKDVKDMSKVLNLDKNDSSPDDKAILQIVYKKRRRNGGYKDVATNQSQYENLKEAVKEKKEGNSDENVEKHKKAEINDVKGEEEGRMKNGSIEETPIQYWDKVELELKTGGRLVEIEIRGKVIEFNEKIHELKKNTEIKIKEIDNPPQEQKHGKKEAFIEFESSEQEKIGHKCDNPQLKVEKADPSMKEVRAKEENKLVEDIEIGHERELKLTLVTNVEKRSKDNVEINTEDKNINMEEMMQEIVKDTKEENKEASFEEAEQKIENIKEHMQKREILEKPLERNGNFDEMEKGNERNLEETVQESEDRHLQKIKQEKEEHMEEAIPEIHEHIEEAIPEIHEHIEEAIPEIHEHIEETIPETHEHIEETIPETHEHIEETIPKIHEHIEENIPEIHEHIEETIPEIHEHIEETIPEIHEYVEETIPEIHEQIGGLSSEIDEQNQENQETAIEDVSLDDTAVER